MYLLIFRGREEGNKREKGAEGRVKDKRMGGKRETEKETSICCSTYLIS